GTGDGARLPPPLAHAPRRPLDRHHRRPAGESPSAPAGSRLIAWNSPTLTAANHPKNRAAASQNWKIPCQAKGPVLENGRATGGRSSTAPQALTWPTQRGKTSSDRSRRVAAATTSIW